MGNAKGGILGRSKVELKKSCFRPAVVDRQRLLLRAPP